MQVERRREATRARLGTLVLAEVLAWLGVGVERGRQRLELDVPDVVGNETPAHLVSQLRASIVADPHFERKNTKDNTPAVVNIRTESRQRAQDLTEFFGGEGGMRNTILGLLIFGILSNGLNLLPNIPITFKQALQGIVLLAALLLNVFALRIERVQTRSE